MESKNSGINQVDLVLFLQDVINLPSGENAYLCANITMYATPLLVRQHSPFIVLFQNVTSNTVKFRNK
jgi:hypothetical protein